MARKSYSEKLKDPRWQKKRLEVLGQQGWTCRKCHSTTTPFHVHHGWYPRGKEPWEADSRTLHAICEKCHPDVQHVTDLAHYLVGRLPPTLLWVICGALAAMNPEATRGMRVPEFADGPRSELVLGILPMICLLRYCGDEDFAALREAFKDNTIHIDKRSL